MRPGVGMLLMALLACGAKTARAQSVERLLDATPRTQSEGARPVEKSQRAAEPERAFRPFVLSVDANTLGAGRVALESGAGYNGVLQSNTLLGGDSRRFDTWMTAAVGLSDVLELSGTALLSETPGRGVGFGEGRVELRARLYEWRGPVSLALLVGGGYQADARFESAVTAMAAATVSWRRLDLAVNLRGLHYFHDGRDPIDLYVTAAAAVRVVRGLRLGAEYVGEELEEEPAGALRVDGGSRHYLGPSASLQAGALRINLTGGAVLASVGTGPMVRGSVAWVF